MAEDIFELSGTAIPKGSDTAVDIELPKLYNTPTKLPVHVIRGKKSGPTVFVSAAVHGDELNGIEIIRRLRKLKILKRLRGTLILVPIVNIYGIMTLSRYLPDRRDLNRSFPGSAKGSLASRVAKTFFEQIVSKCDFGIDLHTAAIHRSNLPQIRTNTNNPFTLKLAKAFEAPVILHSELRDGSLRAEALEAGIPVLLYEAGEALRFNETAIRIGVKGIVNVLRESEMLPRTPAKRRAKIPAMTKSSAWVRAVESGMVRTLKDLGDTVQQGQVIAYINEPLVDEGYELVAPFDGIIIGRSEIPLVQAGDAVFHIARFKDLDRAEERIEYFSDDALEQSEFAPLQGGEEIE